MKKTCQEKAEDRAGYGSGQAQERNRNILGEPGLWVWVHVYINTID